MFTLIPLDSLQHETWEMHVLIFLRNRKNIKVEAAS